MKRDDIKALHDLSPEDLKKKLAELHKQLAEARLSLKASKLKDLTLPRKLADDVARIKTILTEKRREQVIAELTKQAQESMVQSQSDQE